MNANAAGPSTYAHKRRHGPQRQFLAAPMSEDDAQPARKRRPTQLRRAPGPLAVVSTNDVPMDLKTHPPVQRAPRRLPHLNQVTITERPLPEVPIAAQGQMRARRKGKEKEKEREREREAVRKLTQPSGRRPSEAITVPSDDDDDDDDGYDGPGLRNEIGRLRAQLAELKKQVLAKDKLIEDHAKNVAKYRRDLQAANKDVKSQRAELDKARAQSKQSNELVASIESTLQCQICIDTLAKPCALAPCGHVLCQACLQTWFRRAPTGDDMDTDGDPVPVVHRRKTCPVCRARVRARPLPLFVLKSVLNTLEKASAGAAGARVSPPLEDGDPWKGIFAERGEELSSDGSASSDEAPSSDEDDEDDDESDEDEDPGLLDIYDDTSDDEYAGGWVLPSWDPPAWRGHSLHAEGLLDAMLRRGATLAMIEAFDMEYTHEEGLSVSDRETTLYLGWNIELAEDDEDGSTFVEWCWEDIAARPERWMEDEFGYTRLVREDCVGEWRDTDSEGFMGESGEESE